WPVVSSNKRWQAVLRGRSVVLIDAAIANRDRADRQALDPLLRKLWHSDHTAEAEKAKDWFAAAFHVDRLLELRPQDGQLLARRDRCRGAVEEERERLQRGPGRMEPVPADARQP